jgi:hypothetical protein
MNEDRKTKFGVAPGSVFYMSPEQIQTPRSIDHRSDIYSFGCVLYEMLTGRPPFGSETDSDFTIRHAHVHRPPEPMRKWNPQVPFEFEWIVLRALQKDRERRFASAQDMANAIREEIPKLPGGLTKDKTDPKKDDKKNSDKKGLPPQPRPLPWKAIVAGIISLAVATLGLAIWAVWPHPVEITSVKFFSYQGKLAAEGSREYHAHFRQDEVAGIGWETALNGPVSKSTTMTVVWHWAGGQERRETQVIPAKSDKVANGLGWDKPGNWIVGAYTIDYVLEGKTLASGQFFVDAPPVVRRVPPPAQYDIPSLSATVQGLQYFGTARNQQPAAWGSRMYYQTFSLTYSPCVYWELKIHRDVDDAQNFEIETYDYLNGSELYRHTKSFRWDAGGPNPGYYSDGVCWPDQIGNRGTYTVQLWMDGQKIAQGEYTME